MSSPIFSEVKAAYAQTSLFNLSFENKLTTNFFRLTPFLCKEVLPGDIFRVNTEMLVRLAPMFAPLMHRIRVYSHFFFVPYRLLWDNWEAFITQSNQGHNKVNAAGDFIIDYPTELPLVSVGASVMSDESSTAFKTFAGSGSLADYLGLNFSKAGLNNSVGNDIEQTVFQYLPFLAYQKVYNDFYRDENIEEDDFVPAVDGLHLYDTVNNPVDQLFPKLRYRYWPKDYFTSALPWLQKGNDVTLPIGDKATFSGRTGTSNVSVYPNATLPSSLGTTNLEIERQAVGNQWYFRGDTSDRNDVQFILQGAPTDVTGTLDLSQATPTTINELRRAIALQRWEELNARGGTRYVEQLASHFGVRPRDARLQRAEYLGGGVSDVTISEVLQTSATNIDGSTTPQGAMAGHGISASFNHAFKRYFDEHGVIIGILSIMPDANYYQGAQRMYLKRGVYDFAWPSLAHLGEQPIYREEIYNFGLPRNVEANGHLFGYTPRYAEYKFSNDEIHGDFRTSLQNWHGARVFSNPPELNRDFANGENYAASQDIFAVSDVDPFWIQIYNNVKAVRKLPKFGTPSIL